MACHTDPHSLTPLRGAGRSRPQALKRSVGRFRMRASWFTPCALLATAVAAQDAATTITITGRSNDPYRARDEVHIVLRNPYRHGGSHHAGNKMAVGNIRERLMLHFDAEASLRTTVTDNAYQVHIVLPYRTEAG